MTNECSAAVRSMSCDDAHLSAEWVFEVEVEDRAGGLAAEHILQVEFVSLQDVVDILGLPVNDCPAK